MTLIADECVYEPIIQALEAVHYRIVRIREVGSVRPDSVVMQTALDRGSVLLTLDIGIPSQAYVDEYASKGLSVVLLRWKKATPKDWQQIVETILRDGEKWEAIAAEAPCVISVQYGRMRVRRWSDIPPWR